MMRSIFLISSIFCLLYVGDVSAQDRSSTVPSGAPIPYNQRSFSIPFEVHNNGIGDPPKEIELLYSSDRGVRWFSAKRVPVDAKKFDFTAPSDGEYWFIFRTISLSGVIKAANPSKPPLRVLVDTTLPDTAPSTTSQRPDSMVPAAVPTTNTLRSSENSAPQTVRETSGVPITPPKPPRQIRDTTEKKTAEHEKQVAPKNPRELPMLFSPSGEAVSLLPPTETEENRRLTFDPLLAEMSRFYETTPKKSESSTPAPAPTDQTTTADQSGQEMASSGSPGTIAGISLADVQRQPRIMVRWITGDEPWRTANVDVLRSTSPQGPWLPVATNLPNSGEYWWFATNEDFKPFYISVRLRNHTGASTSNETRSPIRIDPAMFNSSATTPIRQASFSKTTDTTFRESHLPFFTSVLRRKASS